MIKRVILGSFGAILATAICSSLAVPAHAVYIDITVKTECTTEPSYNATTQLENKEYDAYVKLPRRGENAVVTGFAQVYGDKGNCKMFPATTVSGDKWTKIGSFTPTDTSTETVIELASPILRPSLMLTALPSFCYLTTHRHASQTPNAGLRLMA